MPSRPPSEKVCAETLPRQSSGNAAQANQYPLLSSPVGKPHGECRRFCHPRNAQRPAGSLRPPQVRQTLVPELHSTNVRCLLRFLRSQK
ncbi:Uncharacterised protein [Vibrio cholerae]|nr:Uncharacterised protein [Vibrio cholerae]CSI54402.1 Uncharacterised protein [Vibrio cholerae]CSI62809.1 Uncharacterised protein [Vibrio cholerae]